MDRLKAGRARRTAAVVALTIAASATAAVRATPALAADPLPEDLSLIISGGGWGHGHGMSQYGARAQAEAGRTFREILSSYYKNVSIVNRGQETMRVLVSTGSTLVVGGPESYTAKWSSGATIASSSSSYPYMRVRPTADGVRVERAASPTGSWSTIATGSGRVRFYPVGSAMPVVRPGGEHRYFRGIVEGYRRSSDTIYGINQLRMDEYLYGVVPREMPSSWHENALRAQAIAARSYSSWKRANAPSGASYHICATTQCQVYGGYGYRTSAGASMVRLETARTNDAIAATAGLTMVDAYGPIFAEFHSSSGGHTSQGSRSYLAPAPDPWDATYSPHHRWQARITVDRIESRWPQIGRLIQIADIARDGDGAWGGRVESMRLVGTSGSVTVGGNAFRSAFSWPGTSRGLRSTLFSIGVYDGTASASPAEIVLAPGQTGTAVVRFRNTGNRSWKVGERVRLGTSSPSDRASIFATQTWVTRTRPAYIAADLTDGGGWVSPGQEAEFRFEVRAPSSATSGVYLERFRPTLVGETWFGDDVTVRIRVAFAGAAHLGANLAVNGSFESADGTAPSGWSGAGTGDAVDAARALDGRATLKVAGVPDARKSLRQVVDARGPAGERLVLSAWNRSTGTRSTGSIAAVLKARLADGSVATERAEFPPSPHGWAYREIALVAPKDYRSLEVALEVASQTGTTWFDRVRVARDAVLNGGFDSGRGTPTSWGIVNGSSGDGRETRLVRSGVGALRLRGAPSVNKYARQSIRLSGRAGEKLRLSGWNRTVSSSANGGPVSLWARIVHADGSIQRHTLSFPRPPHDWGYAEMTFAATEAFSRVDVFARYSAQRGTAWFDEVSLARAPSVRSLSANEGYELGSPAPGEWTLANAPASAGVSSTAASGDASLRLAGVDGVHVHALQRIPLAGSAGDRFALQGYSRTEGSSAGGGPVRVWARFRYLDGTAESFVIEFARGPHDWQRASRAVRAAKPYARVDVYVSFSDQTGSGWFDGVTLRRV